MWSNPEIEASVVSWGDPIQGNARDILHEAESVQDKDEHDERREAAEFLTDFLSDGPKTAKDVRAAADAHCHAWRTIRRAQKELGIEPNHPVIPGPWIWSLPQGGHQNPKMATKPRQGHVAILDEHGHLGAIKEPFGDNVSDTVDVDWGDEV